MAPFLGRPGYQALPRPHDEPRRAPWPEAPPALPAVVARATIARAAQRLRITLGELDDRLSVEDVLDEADLASYLKDCDDEPRDRPPPHPVGGQGLRTRGS